MFFFFTHQEPFKPHHDKSLEGGAGEGIGLRSNSWLESFERFWVFMPFLMDSRVEFKTTSITAGGSETKEIARGWCSVFRYVLVMIVSHVSFWNVPGGVVQQAAASVHSRVCSETLSRCARPEQIMAPASAGWAGCWQTHVHPHQLPPSAAGPRDHVTIGLCHLVETCLRSCSWLFPCFPLRTMAGFYTVHPRLNI